MVLPVWFDLVVIGTWLGFWFIVFEWIISNPFIMNADFDVACSFFQQQVHVSSPEPQFFLQVMLLWLKDDAVLYKRNKRPTFKVCDMLVNLSYKYSYGQKHAQFIRRYIDKLPQLFYNNYNWDKVPAYRVTRSEYKASYDVDVWDTNTKIWHDTEDWKDKCTVQVTILVDSKEFSSWLASFDPDTNLLLLKEFTRQVFADHLNEEIIEYIISLMDPKK